MKKLIYSFSLFVLLTACSESTDGQNKAGVAGNDLKSEIAQLEKQLLETGDATKEMDAALQLVEKTETFVEANPNDEEVGEMLFKAGDVANGAGKYGKAIQLWGEVWRKHPNHARAPMALFLQGFTFDSKLNKGNMARKYYTEFLKQYPEDELAAQVKQLLTVVNTSPEELVKQYEGEQ